tara:strand:+ start:9701 stop:11839 length:2139 start_codon:yes stop_codon:yes gene_type:complete
MIYQSTHIQVEMLDDHMAHLIFNSDGSVNKLDQACLNNLDNALDIIIDQQPKGLLVSSHKPAFIVGADITEFLDLFDQPTAVLMKWLDKANDVFNKLEELPMPTVCAVTGFALGGGCETILACDFRIADTTAVIGLPETKLGILPGFGGTVRLPRVIGAENAIEWMATGRHNKADAALKLGAVDAVVDHEQLIPQALRLLERAINNELDWKSRRTVKQSPLSLNKAESKMAFTTAKAMLAQSVSPDYPAPFKVVDVVKEAAKLDRQDALLVEQEAFIELAKTPTAQSLIQIFLNDQLVKSKAKKQGKKAKSYKKAGVLGAGIMGGGIAYQSAVKGIPAMMKDITQPALDLGLQQANHELLKKLSKNKIKPEKVINTLNSIVPTLDYNSLKDADIIVEAVVEHPDVKADVLTEIEKHVSDEAIITSNTSTISINSLAHNLQKPERFCGMHFFNPVPKMPLVEVIQGESSSKETIATICSYAQKMGKTPIVVQDCTGFFVNRVLFPYFYGFNELLFAGAHFTEIDKVMEKEFGWPMGPAHLLDVVGLDTAHHAQSIMADAYPDRMKQNNKNAVDILFKADRFGKKNQFGFYQYKKNKKGQLKKHKDPATEEILKDHLGPAHNFSHEDIIARCMLPMILESVRCLDQGIIASPAEADIALLYGLGFPAFRGGPFTYIRQMGIKKFVAMADKFESLGPLYHIPESMRHFASSNTDY